MPLINGQKMACEPCIRGHRSTKCTHANERLMVPVRKPGRPLSTCPHPTSRPCSCAAVTAAIPKKQKCGCGKQRPLDDVLGEDEREGGNDGSSPGPSRSAAPAFRIKKQTSINAAGRKRSVDLAALGKMGAHQLNFLPAFEGSQQKQTTPRNDQLLLGSQSFYSVSDKMHIKNQEHLNSNSTIFSLTRYPPLSQGMGDIASKPESPNAEFHSTSEPMTSHIGPKLGDCCDSSSHTSLCQTHLMSLVTSSPSDSFSSKGKKSCCSSPILAESGGAKAQFSLRATTEKSNLIDASTMSSFQGHQPAASDMFSFYTEPTMFAYPPQYGSFLQPLQPEQWREVMSAPSFGHSLSTNGNIAAASLASSTFQHPRTSNTTSWMSHHCSCGDSCQCVGCAAHPYNEATQDYVRSAWNTIVEDSQPAPDSVVDTNETSQVDADPHTRDRSTRDIKTPPNGHQCDAISTPVAPRTPSEAASGASEEQTLSANDFFFVSYPFSDTCAGEMASCPCGDDCRCIGCTIHATPGLTHDSKRDALL